MVQWGHVQEKEVEGSGVVEFCDESVILLNHVGIDGSVVVAVVYNDIVDTSPYPKQ